MNATGALGSRIGQHAAGYGSALLLTVLLGLVNVVVLTRFLGPSAFGDLVTLLFYAELSALVYGLGWLQGGLSLAFGGSLDVDEAADERDSGGARDRGALGAALAATTLIGLAGIGLALVSGGTLADLLIDRRDAGELVVGASGIALFTALWRILSAVPRYRRRPLTFLVVSNARPALMTAGAVPFLAAGDGVGGAVAGGVAGSAAAAVIGAVLARDAVVLRRLRRADARVVFAAGLGFVPVVLALWLLRNAEVYLLAQLAPAREVGIFRVASRAGALMAFPVSALLVAWSTLRRDPVHTAADHQRRAAGGVDVLFSTYFAFLTIWILLAIALAADVLVRIAPPDYDEAAPLIPLVALGLLLHGWFLTIHRVSRARRKRRIYTALVIAELTVFVALALALIPRFGAEGAAWALIGAPAAAAAAAFVVALRAASPVRFAYGRVATAIAVGAGLYGLTRLAAGRDLLELLLAVAAVGLFPLALVALRALPRAERAQLAAALAGAVAPRRSRDVLRRRVDALPDRDRETLELIARRRRPLAEVAAHAGVDEPELRRRFLAALRSAAAIDVAERPSDDLLVDYLLVDAADDRDGVARTLWTQGVDPVEAHALMTALEAARAADAR